MTRLQSCRVPACTSVFLLCAALAHAQDKKLPEAPLPEPAAGDSIYAPLATRDLPPTTKIKLETYVVTTFGPRAIVAPAFSAAIRMARPPDLYPRIWRDGAEAFGRNYGEALLTKVTENTTRTGVAILLHEDFRYRRSETATGFGRFAHAIAYTVVDSSDSGHRRLAVANLAGAAAGGFVGLPILPDSYNNLGNGAVHFGSRMGGIAFQNVTREYAPEIGRFFSHHRLPFPRLPIPEWYTRGLSVTQPIHRGTATPAPTPTPAAP